MPDLDYYNSEFSGSEIDYAVAVAKRIGELSGTIRSRGNGAEGIEAISGGGSGSVFIAIANSQYGTVTTYAQVQTAFSQGMPSAAWTENGCGFMAYFDTTKAIFVVPKDDGSGVYLYTLNSSGWTNSEISQLRPSDLDTEIPITDQSETTAPTTKAVWDLVSSAGAGAQIFIAEYDETEFSDIKTATNAGKIVFVKKGNATGFLTGYSDTSTAEFLVLELVSGSGINAAHYYSKIIVGSGTEWGLRTQDIFEKKSNKVNAITSTASNNQYPSAKAVWDLVYPIQQEITGLNSLVGTGVFS